MIYQVDERQVQFKSTRHFIAANATVVGSAVIGDNVSVWFNAVIRADNDSIIIGDNSNIQEAAVLHTDPGYVLSIGAGVTVGHQAMLHGCTVGDDSLIGIGAIVLNGARIGRNCLIGANTLVPENMDIPDGSLVVGSPAKIRRSLSDEEITRLKRNAARYVENVQRYQRTLVVQRD